MAKNSAIKRVDPDPSETWFNDPHEILSEWKRRKAGGLYYSFPMFLALGYLAYWIITDPGLAFVDVRATLPYSVSLAIAVAVISFISWLFYGFFAFRCPHCHRFVRMDWSFGLETLRRKDLKTTSERCIHCRAELE